MASKKCLVYETLGSINNLQRIDESNDGYLRLSGTFGVCNVRNNNNRVYNKQNYGLMVENLQKEIAQGSVLGELEHPSSMNITLENVSHMIESIQMDDNGVVSGTIKILDTPKGKIARAIAEASGSLFISSRAAGSIDESGNVTLTMLKTYDLVGTPGFSQAKLTLNKGQKFESLCESLEDGNISWMIVDEGDDSSDDLLSDGSDDEKKEKSDDSSDDSKEEKKEEKSDDEKDKKDDEEKKEDEDDEKDNNKNNEDKVTMNELKKSIDELKEKVESLQADLHIANECLRTNSNDILSLSTKINDIPVVNYDAIEEWVSTEFKDEMLVEINETLTNVQNNIADGVQAWVTNEFAPVVEGWVTNEFAPVVEGWVTNEFAPVVESWTTNEFAPMVEGWVTEEFAPQVESWINEELMPTVDSWINEVCIPEHKEEIVNDVNTFLEAKQTEKLTSIDTLLEAIENKDNKDEALELLKEQQIENKFRGVYCVENMPAQYAPQWQMLSEAKQNEIVRSSRMYDFTKEGILENFWASVDFNEQKDQVVEEHHIASDYHSSIFEQAMRLRNC